MRYFVLRNGKLSVFVLVNYRKVELDYIIMKVISQSVKIFYTEVTCKLNTYNLTFEIHVRLWYKVIIATLQSCSILRYRVHPCNEENSNFKPNSNFSSSFGILSFIFSKENFNCIEEKHSIYLQVRYLFYLRFAYACVFQVSTSQSFIS